MPGFFIHNGNLHQENESVISVNNRSFRFGDGLFETLRLHKGSIPLWEYHQQRLFSGLKKLNIEIPAHFNSEFLLLQLEKLKEVNKLSTARMRITLYRGNGGLYDPPTDSPGFIIQGWHLPEGPVQLNKEGWKIGFYGAARKPLDEFSAIKSNNFLPYLQAALHAQKHQLDDAVVLNSAGRIADSTIANLFWVHQGRIFTPPLSEGPIAGVMRRYLLENALIHEQPVLPESLVEADEIFLTNAVRGIQWVSLIENKVMKGHKLTGQLFSEFVQPLFL